MRMSPKRRETIKMQIEHALNIGMNVCFVSNNGSARERRVNGMTLHKWESFKIKGIKPDLIICDDIGVN